MAILGKWVPAVLLLAACAAQPTGPISARDEGCSSGFVAAGHPYYKFQKDTTRYIADPIYKSDWDDGFAVCKGKYEALR